MDPSRFDALTRALAFGQSRRQAISAFSLSALALLGGLRGATAGPGCKDVGKPCKKATSCCSNVCKGKKGKKKCKAHDSGGCKPGSAPVACGGALVPCTTSLGDSGFCTTTTGNAGYCALVLAGEGCSEDADCKLSAKSRSACIDCPDAPSGRVCAAVN